MTKDELQEILMQCWHRETSVDDALDAICGETMVEETLWLNADELRGEVLEQTSYYITLYGMNDCWNPVDLAAEYDALIVQPENDWQINIILIVFTHNEKRTIEVVSILPE